MEYAVGFPAASLRVCPLRVSRRPFWTRTVRGRMMLWCWLPATWGAVRMGITNTTSEVESLYSEALERYLAGGGEDALRGAYEVGRLALSREVGLLDLAALHQAALLGILAETPEPDEIRARCRAASQFFAECLSPYEMAHRGYHDAVA